MGSIEQGKVANLILTKNNPLENISVLSEPEWVMVRGRKVDKTLLTEFKNKAQDRSNLIVTAIRYDEYLLVEK